MFRDDVPGCGVYRHSDGKLVKQCNTHGELLHGQFYSSTPTLDAFLADAGYTPYETIADTYTVYSPIPGFTLASPFKEALEGIRYLVQVNADPKAQFFILISDSLLDYLSVLELLQPLVMHKRMVAEDAARA
ncbi:hypothetical protein SAMN05661010_02569 [Modicisalibacter muralis]|uniref:Uncharacterized protein n=1 Tax=Modicisalibacter muralis TaxID=119000 RepID=A0A1G9N027_9GAMM|nr:hypothetical protein [Halomonas muralis]SDL79225.1 hypothetical protein SAMN05661010_02569 [Halomonas muralis]